MIWALTQWEAFTKIALLLNVKVIRPSGFSFPLCQIPFLVWGLLRKSRILRLSLLLPPSLLKGGRGGWGLGMPLVLLPVGLPLLQLDLVQREGWKCYWTLVRCSLRLLFPWLLLERGCQESLVAADACCLLCPVSVGSPLSSLHALRGDELRESSEACSLLRSSRASRVSTGEAWKDRRARSRQDGSRD